MKFYSFIHSSKQLFSQYKLCYGDGHDNNYLIINITLVKMILLYLETNMETFGQYSMNFLNISNVESKTINELTKIEFIRLQVLLCVLDVTQ